jgi:exoribonuclease-2
MTGVRHARGTQLKLELIDWDEVDLGVQARVLEVAVASAALADEIELEESDVADEAEQAAEQIAEQQAEQQAEPLADSRDAPLPDVPAPGTPE